MPPPSVVWSGKAVSEAIIQAVFRNPLGQPATHLPRRAEPLGQGFRQYRFATPTRQPAYPYRVTFTTSKLRTQYSPVM